MTIVKYSTVAFGIRLKVRPKLIYKKLYLVKIKYIYQCTAKL